MEAIQSRQNQRYSVGILKKFVTVIEGNDPIILMATIALAVFGSIMIISTQLGQTVGDTRTLIIEMAKQGLFLVLGWELMVAVSRLFTYRRAEAVQGYLVIFYLFLLIAVQAFGRSLYGSKAWISLFGFSLQPSEFGKPLLILVSACAAWQVRRSRKKQDSVLCWRLPLFVMALSAFFLLVFQKDLGSLVITLLIGACGILVPRWKGLKVLQRLILIGLLCALVLAVMFMLFSEQIAHFLNQFPNFSYIGIRIENMANPYLDVHEGGYQPANALYAIADSGLWGKGLGASVRKYGFLTQAESDYILAVVIEETGLFGLLGIAAGYGAILWRLIFWSVKARLVADRVLLTGTAAYLAAHFFINVGGVSSLIPMTGVPLLLISSGGSSLLAVSIALGMAQARIAAIRRREETPA